VRDKEEGFVVLINNYRSLLYSWIADDEKGANKFWRKAGKA